MSGTFLELTCISASRSYEDVLCVLLCCYAIAPIKGKFVLGTIQLMRIADSHDSWLAEVSSWLAEVCWRVFWLAGVLPGWLALLAGRLKSPPGWLKSFLGLLESLPGAQESLPGWLES